MKRNHIIVIAVIAFVALYMYSQSGKASTANCDGVYSDQVVKSVSRMT